MSNKKQKKVPRKGTAAEEEQHALDEIAEEFRVIDTIANNVKHSDAQKLQYIKDYNAEVLIKRRNEREKKRILDRYQGRNQGAKQKGKMKKNHKKKSKRHDSDSSSSGSSSYSDDDDGDDSSSSISSSEEDYHHRQGKRNKKKKLKTSPVRCACCRIQCPRWSDYFYCFICPRKKTITGITSWFASNALATFVYLMLLGFLLALGWGGWGGLKWFFRLLFVR
jgi:hypothetical protein